MSISGIIQRVLNKLVRKSYWYNNIAFGNCEKFWMHRTFDLDVVNLGSSSSVAAFDYSGFVNLKTANWAMTPQTLVADLEILRNYSCYLRKGATVIIPLCPFSCLARKPKTTNLEVGNFAADAKMRMESWRKEFSMIRFTDPLSLVNKDAYEDGAKILSRIVDYCVERDFNPIIVMPPVTEALREQFTSEMKKLFIDDFIKEGIGNKAKFLDYFEDKRFDLSDFQNSFIMNSEGAIKFTGIVLKDAEVVK